MRPQPPNEATFSPEDRVNVQVDEPFAAAVDAADLTATIHAALVAESRPDGEVTLVITDDEQVHALNLQYLGEDHPTDVLSFPTAEAALPDVLAADPTAAHFVSAPEAAGYLGDIIIAFPYAERQATGLGRAVRDELRLLAVHGTLHLLGYDHADAGQQAAMWARQDAILAQLPA
jgi:probable rRNA maturation factor